MTDVLILLRAYVVWALLIGQGVLIAMWATGLGWRLIDSPAGAEWIVGIVAASGVAGLAGEWAWNRWRERGDPMPF